MYRRMTNQPVVVTTTQDSLSLPLVQDDATVQAPNGVALSYTPRSWRFCMGGKSANDPTDDAFTRVVTGDLSLPSEGTVDSFLDAALDYYEWLKVTKLLPEAIRLGEMDNAKKITIQKGRRADGFLGRLGLWPPRVVDAAALQAVAIEAVDYYSAVAGQFGIQAASIPVGSPAWRDGLLTSPLTTNSGWPCFRSGAMAKLVTASLGGIEPTPGSVHDESLMLGASLGLARATTQAFGLGFRAGPAYKALPDWRYVGPGQFIATKSVAGAWPRARHIFMGPFTNNVALLGLWTFLSAVQKASPGLQRVGSYDDDLIASLIDKGFRLMESDISGYDQSVTPSLQDALATQLSRSFPHLAREVELWRYWEGRAVISPTWFQRPENFARPSGVAVGTHGGTHSGVKTTAAIGTILNVGMTRWVLRSLGYTPTPPGVAPAGHSREAFILVQGDDTIIATKRPIDESKWNELWLSIGFDTKLLAGCRFLSRHRTATGAMSIGARIIQNTGSPEYVNVGSSALGLNYLGLLGRLDVEPHPLVADRVHACLMILPWYADLGTNSLMASRKAILDTKKEVIAQALRDQEGEAWAARLQAEQEYSPSSRYALKFLTEQGIAVKAAERPEWFADAVERLLRVSRTERIDATHNIAKDEMK